MAVIFISCGTVSGVRTLIQCLHERMGIKCFSREDLIKEISLHGEWATEVMSRLSEVTYSYENFTKNRRTYIVLMRQALLEKIRDDNVVYYGLFGHLLVPRFKHFIRIRISAPLYVRVPMTMERLKCDEKSAREYINSSDYNQVRWARFMYGVDISNPSLYDVNIHLGHLSISVVSNILENILQKDDLQIEDKLKAQMKQTLLAANVEAALTIDPRTRNLEINAVSENGYIHLIGPYLDNTKIALVKEIVHQVEGVVKVEYNVGFVSLCKEEHLYPTARADKRTGLIQYEMQ